MKIRIAIAKRAAFSITMAGGPETGLLARGFNALAFI
jgi:hypothetical protein